MQPQEKSWTVTLLLAIFLGEFGIHRFYTGHVALGVLMLLTGGGFGIIWLYDILVLIFGAFKDSEGRSLK
jgi:TM2 domain-containing membrane protein YozV